MDGPQNRIFMLPSPNVQPAPRSGTPPRWVLHHLAQRSAAAKEQGKGKGPFNHVK